MASFPPPVRASGPSHRDARGVLVGRAVVRRLDDGETVVEASSSDDESEVKTLDSRLPDGLLPIFRPWSSRRWRSRGVAYTVADVAARSKLLTTDELLAAAGVTRETLYRWVAQRLVKRPTFTTASDGSVIAVWPREALTRMRFVGKKQETGLTARELGALVRERWPTIRK